MSKYSGINAKINAMRSKLLTDSDYLSLASSKNVSEVAAKLKEYEAYSDVLKSSNDVHRLFLERKIILAIYEDFSRIFKFVTDVGIREYLGAFFMKNEINLLKSMLRTIDDKRTIGFSLPEINELMGKNMKFDFTALFNTRSVADAIETLKNTRYYSILKTRDGDTNLFNLEMRLDIYYYLYLNKLQKKHLHGINKKIAEKINGIEIDMTNISWIYRLKRYYKLDNVSMYAYLIPLHYLLKKENITKMVETKNLNELLDEIHKTPYGKYFTDSTSFERKFYVLKNKTLARMRTNYPESIANVLAYIYFKEREIRNIISLTEGVRYGLSVDEIKDYVIAPSEREVT